MDEGSGRADEAAGAGDALQQSETGVALQLLMDTVIDTERIRAEQQAIESLPSSFASHHSPDIFPRRRRPHSLSTPRESPHLTFSCVQAAVQRLIQIQVCTYV